MQRQLNKLLAPIQRRIRQIATRAVIAVIDTETTLVTLRARISESEVLDGLEYFEPYGFTTSPPPSSEALLVSLGGRREHTVVVQVASRKYRLVGLESGDVALYNQNGDKFVMKASGETELQIETKVTMTCPNFEINGDMQINGNITHQGNLDSSGNHKVGGNQTTDGNVTVGGNVSASGDVKAGSVSLKLHTHGGVQSGGSSTSLPS